MSTWKKEPMWESKIFQGCLNCPPVARIATMDMVIAVGFGDAHVSRDGENVYTEPCSWSTEDLRTLSEFEAMAAADPDHDWRVIMNAPLRNREYQRHDTGTWVLIDSGMGFA